MALMSWIRGRACLWTTIDNNNDDNKLYMA